MTPTERNDRLQALRGRLHHAGRGQRFATEPGPAEYRTSLALYQTGTLTGGGFLPAVTIAIEFGYVALGRGTPHVSLAAEPTRSVAETIEAVRQAYRAAGAEAWDVRVLDEASASPSLTVLLAMCERFAQEIAPIYLAERDGQFPALEALACARAEIEIACAQAERRPELRRARAGWASLEHHLCGGVDHLLDPAMVGTERAALPYDEARAGRARCAALAIRCLLRAVERATAHDEALADHVLTVRRQVALARAYAALAQDPASALESRLALLARAPKEIGRALGRSGAGSRDELHNRSNVADHLIQAAAWSAAGL